MRVKESSWGWVKEVWSLKETRREEEMRRGVKRMRERIWVVKNELWEKNGGNWRSLVVKRRNGVFGRRIEMWRREVFWILKGRRRMNVGGGENMWSRGGVVEVVGRVGVLWIDEVNSWNVGS